MPTCKIRYCQHATIWNAKSEKFLHKYKFSLLKSVKTNFFLHKDRKVIWDKTLFCWPSVAYLKLNESFIFIWSCRSEKLIFGFRHLTYIIFAAPYSISWCVSECSLSIPFAGQIYFKKLIKLTVDASLYGYSLRKRLAS